MYIYKKIGERQVYQLKFNPELTFEYDLILVIFFARLGEQISARFSFKQENKLIF